MFDWLKQKDQRLRSGRVSRITNWDVFVLGTSHPTSSPRRHNKAIFPEEIRYSNVNNTSLYTQFPQKDDRVDSIQRIIEIRRSHNLYALPTNPTSHYFLLPIYIFLISDKAIFINSIPETFFDYPDSNHYRRW